MIEILYRLQALYQFYKSAHWLSKGDGFYQNHLLFRRLSEGFDDEMDALAELMLVYVAEDSELLPEVISRESIKFIPKFGDFKKNVKSALEKEDELALIIQKLNPNEIPVGLYNHLASIAQNHTRNTYLLNRSL